MQENARKGMNWQEHEGTKQEKGMTRHENTCKTHEKTGTYMKRHDKNKTTPGKDMTNRTS